MEGAEVNKVASTGRAALERNIIMESLTGPRLSPG